MLFNSRNFVFSGYKGPVGETVKENGTKYPIVFQLVSTDHPYYHIGLQPSKSYNGKTALVTIKI